MRGLGALVLLVVSVGSAYAQQPPPPPQQTPAQQKAEKLFTEGRELIKAENYEGACAKFKEAIEADKTAPGVMLNLGLCNEKLDKIATSLRWYRQALLAASNAGLTDYEQVASERVADLATKVPTLTIQLGASPANTEVLVDGEKVSPSDYGKLELDKGNHKVDGSTPGKSPFSTTVSLSPGQHADVEIKLGEIEMRTVVVDRGKSRRLVAYGVAGLGTVAMVFSGIYASKAAKDWNADPADNKDREDAKTKLNIGTGIFVGGAALVVAGAVIWFTAPGKEERQEPATAWLPVISTDHAGIAYSRSF